jgi:hypothetical protein
MKEKCEARNCKGEVYGALETSEGIKFVCAKHYHIGLSTRYDERMNLLRSQKAKKKKRKGR